jgi:hypothetical protein
VSQIEYRASGFEDKVAVLEQSDDEKEQTKEGRMEDARVLQFH